MALEAILVCLTQLLCSLLKNKTQEVFGVQQLKRQIILLEGLSLKLKLYTMKIN